MDEVRIHRLRSALGSSDVTSLVRKFTTTSVGCLVGVTTPTTVFAAAATTTITITCTIGVTTIEHRQRHTVGGVLVAPTPTPSLGTHVAYARTCIRRHCRPQRRPPSLGCLSLRDPRASVCAGDTLTIPFRSVLTALFALCAKRHRT